MEEGKFEDENTILEETNEENNEETTDNQVSEEEDKENLDEIIDSNVVLDNEKEKPESNKSVNEEDKVENKKVDSNTGDNRDNESSSSEIKEESNPSITIVIIGPDNTSILDTTEVDFKDGDTAFDKLKQVVKDNNIQMDYSGKKSSVYIRGIDNIYEFDKGPESGWIFRVNGEISQASSGAYKLNDGDKIEWLYTVDLGREFESKGGGE